MHRNTLVFAVIGAVAAAIAVLVAFVHRCRRHPIPVVDLALFRYRFFSAANLSSLLFSAGFFGMFFTNVSFLQGVWHYSPIRSGLAVAPGPTMAAIFAGPAGSWASRFGHKQIIVPGLAIFAAGIALLHQRLGLTPSYVTEFLPAFMITGVGVGLVISTLGSASNAYLPPNRFGMGSALNSTGRQLGAALGIATVTALRASGPANDPIAGFQRAYVFIIVTSLLAGVAMLALFRRPTTAEIEASRVIVPAS